MIASTLLVALLALGAAPPDDVEPSELSKRADLLGHEIVVDDRIRYFLESKRGQGFDEMYLKRTDVVFRLPARLKLSRSPSEPVARARGILREEGGRRVFDVSAVEFLPNDPDRLEREIARLRPDDFAGKRQWALWAERRGQELNEPKLEARGAELEGEALWSEAMQPGADALALAERASERPIPAQIRDALAHRGFRDRLARTKTAADRDALAKRIERMLPDSALPGKGSAVEGALREAYAKDPASAYRDAPIAARASLDRDLLADAIQGLLEQQVRDDPTTADALAEQAASRLPDRPEVAESLRRRARDEAEARVASMRQTEVEDLARVFRERGEQDRARKLLQTWLADRRENRLSGSDAEGRVLLALNYERMLGDRVTAAELLREALGIDAGSKPAADAFLRMGFRKAEGGWVDPRASANASPSDEAAQSTSSAMPPTGIGDSLKGLTRGQVRARLGGKPDRIARSATQGQCVEQWIYANARGTQVINFLVESHSIEPRVISYFSESR